MIHHYKDYLRQAYMQLPQPDMLRIPWKFLPWDASYFATEAQQIFVPFTKHHEIIVCDVYDFYAQYPVLAHQYLYEQIQKFPGQHQWNMYAHAYAQKQWVVYIPPGINMQDSFVVNLDYACTEHVTIIVAQGAQALLHEKMFARSGKRIKNVDIIIEHDAHLNFIVEHYDADDMFGYVQYHFFLYNNAHLIGTFALLGGKATMTTIDIELCAPGAQADIKGLYILDNDRQSIVSTRQQHRYKETLSNVIVKGIVADQAHAVYHGTISIAQHAFKAEAYQENKNIVLSKTAKVFSQPNLEIQTDDVRCKHGSAIGSFDADQVLYMQSRGLSIEIAQQLLLQSFIADVRHPDIPITMPKAKNSL